MALDLGTTGNRALLFDQHGQVLAQAYRELPQIYPQPGWLEHDPQQIWQDTLWAMRTVFQKAGIRAEQVAAVGLSVQRETCLLWDPTTGQPLHNAIVWQDRRTAPLCQEWIDRGLEPERSANAPGWYWMPISPPANGPGFGIISNLKPPPKLGSGFWRVPSTVG